MSYTYAKGWRINYVRSGKESLRLCNELIAVFFLTVVWISSANAQADYFTANRSPGSYLTSVEGAHVSTIPDWLNKGRVSAALEDVRYTLDRFPNHPVSLEQLSVVARMAGNISLAVNYFERAVILYPRYAITWAQYGVFLMGIGNVDAGIAKLKKSIELEPKLAAGYAGLAHAYAKKGDIQQAREAAQKARELGFNGKLPEGI